MNICIGICGESLHLEQQNTINGSSPENVYNTTLFSASPVTK
jgi:hypothetical protein